MHQFIVLVSTCIRHLTLIGSRVFDYLDGPRLQVILVTWDLGNLKRQ